MIHPEDETREEPRAGRPGQAMTIWQKSRIWESKARRFFAMAECAERQIIILTRLCAVLAANGFLPVEQVQEAIGNSKVRTFLKEFVERYSKGEAKDTAVLEAMKKAYKKGGASGKPQVWRDETLVKRGYANLERPDVCVAIEAMYAEKNFTPEQAAEIHIQHIKGEAPEKANYQALRDYTQLVTPKQPHKFEGRIVGGIGLFSQPTAKLETKDVTPQLEGVEDKPA